MDSHSMDEVSKLPSALHDFSRIEDRFEGKRIGIFLDYDGTLTPIVNRPELAVLSNDMRRLLYEVGDLCATAIISGRALGELRGLVRVDTLYYAGSHGFEIVGPTGSGIQHEFGSEFVPAIESAHTELCTRLGDIEGVILENKRYSLSVHYRLVREDLISAIDRELDGVLTRHPTLRRTTGKKVFEVRPRLDWDKGKAVQLISRLLGLNTTAAIAVYVGDDTTDEDAFRALAGTGIGILVAHEPRSTAALYGLDDTGEVKVFLERIVARERGRTASS